MWRGLSLKSSHIIIICTYSSSMLSGLAMRMAPCTHEVPRCRLRTPWYSVMVAGGWPGWSKRVGMEDMAGIVPVAGEKKDAAASFRVCCAEVQFFLRRRAMKPSKPRPPNIMA